MPLRKRKEIQKMLWRLMRLWSSALLALVAEAAILPEKIVEFTRGEERPVTLTERRIWDEFGYDDAAQADYSGPDGKFHLTVWRLKDSTGAMAAFRWFRPAGMVDSKWEKLAVENAESLFFAFGNYLFRYDGRRPKAGEFELLASLLPKFEKSALPSTPGFLPAKNRVTASDRYLLGPASLEAFAPSVPPSAAAFSTGAEGIGARFSSPAGELRLVIFSYPTPHIARDRLPEFQKIAGAVVKRSGPLVAVVLPPADRDEAERLLAEVRYEANVTLNQRMPGQGENPGNLILAIFVLIGILLLFATTFGFALGGFRILWRKVTGQEVDRQEMIVLHLEDK